MNNNNLIIKKKKDFFLWEIIKMLSKNIYVGMNINNVISLVITENSIKDVIFFLKNYTKTQFKMLIDICGVDFINRKARFEIVYHLLSVRYSERITLKISTTEISTIFSINSLFPNSDWYEREIWDLYGINFVGHNDLRRILTDYGFEGHPLRKDYPLTGFFELRYDEKTKQVISEKVEFTQKNRFFNYNYNR